MTIQIARRLGQALNIRSGSRIKTIDDCLRAYGRAVAQGPTVPMIGSIDAAQVISGTFADGLISQSSVTQHEAALNIDWLQLTSVPSLFPPSDHLTTGSWTPADNSGAGLSISVSAATYVKHEKLVLARALVSYPATADASVAILGGLPFALNADVAARQGVVTYADVAALRYILPLASSSNIRFYDSAGSGLTNAQLTLGTISLFALYSTT